MVRSGDLLLIIGTSGEVALASFLPFIARDYGALIGENNLEPTRLTYSLTGEGAKGASPLPLPQTPTPNPLSFW